MKKEKVDGTNISYAMKNVGEKIASQVLNEVEGKFILLYEMKTGIYKFSISGMVPKREDMRQLMRIATEIFEAADREEIGNEILQTIKTK